MKQTQTVSLKEKVYNDILNDIVQGEFKAGQVITEQELVRRYEVSKSPVREALILLTSETILTNIPRYGYQVFSFTLGNVANIMGFRSVLEYHLLCKSIDRICPSDIARLRGLIRQEEPESNVWEHWQINENFHLMLASLAQNEYCYQQLRRAMRLLKLAYAQFYWSQWNRAALPNDLKNHSSILDGLEQGDLDFARRCLKDDLADFCMQ